MEIITKENLTPDLDVVTTVDFDNGMSIDITSIDKHVYCEYDTIENGFEAFVYARDGTGDYISTGELFKTIEDVEKLLADDRELLGIIKNYTN